MASSLNDHQFDHYPYLVSLNLDEFIIGKPNSLDHEPLIKNVITSAEEEKIMMQNPNSSNFSSSCSSSSSPPIIHENPNKESAYTAADDVWNDQMRNPLNYVMQNGGLSDIQEDFLQSPPPLMSKIDQEYMKWQQQEMMDSLQLQAVVGSQNKVFDENKVSTTQLVVEKSADAHFESGENKVFNKDEKMVKSVERRQKRMIKNRESAARSRARKQDYINQLQHKVSQLQTSNKLLKKRKEVCALLNSISISGPRYQLRQTSSAHF